MIPRGRAPGRRPDTVDLHLHSTASDGLVEPVELVREASRHVSGISLTDHDTSAGVAEAAAEAARLGMDFLVGAELSANEPGRSVHILAYGFDVDDPGMVRFFADFRSDRHRRAEEIVRRLNRLGLGLRLEDVLAEAGRGVPTRSHIARALVRTGWVATVSQAFARFIARDRPAFVEKRSSPPDSVFHTIHEAGGVALLAHPGADFSTGTLRRWIAAGLDGLEIRHPRNRAADRQRLEALVRRHDLLRGGGSDWHGPDSGRVSIGSEAVPAAWMRAIIERCRPRAG